MSFMAQTTALPTYSAVYAFGDSLSDAGNLSKATGAGGIVTGGTQPVSPPYFQQKYGSATGNVFSNGPTWVQNLSIALGLGTLAPSLSGGTDFAYGGAVTGSAPQNTDQTVLAVSLGPQFAQFQAQVPKPSAGALYTLSVGANDLLNILSNSSLSAAQQSADVAASVANEISFVKQLVGDGATNLLVLGVPDLSKTPDITTGRVNGTNVSSAALVTEASQLASTYNADLISQLGTIASPTVSIKVVDSSTLLDNAIADPALYGLTNVTTPVWNGNYTSGSSGVLAAGGAAAQNQFLYFDFLHPTETGHQAIAALAEQDLSGTPVLTVQNTTTGQPVAAAGQVYTGPVIGPLQQYINITPDNLNITATTPNWFLHGGSGLNSITASSGTNVLDGDSGSTFFNGGSGTDTFYVDARAATANSWSTITNFHASDSATLWGVSTSDFTLSWLSGQGAAGFTGLTLAATEAGKPSVALTFAGFTQADLTSGRLSVAFGSDAASGVYTTIRAVA
jgi:phospholipase/lecithinase/hemolysin